MRSKRIACIMMLLLMVLLTGITPTTLFAQSGIVHLEGQEIDILSPISHAIITKDAQQIYSFKVSEDVVLDIEFTMKSSTSSFQIMKYDNGVYTPVEGYFYEYKNNLKRYYYSLSQSSDLYYIIFQCSSGTDTYSFSAVKINDVSNHLDTANEVSFDTLTHETIYTLNDVDYYKFNTGANDLIKIVANPDVWGMSTVLYSVYKDVNESDSNLVGQWKYSNLNVAETNSGYIKLQKNTTYYLKVSLYNVNPCEYAFTLKGFVDVTDSEKSASIIKINKAITGLCEVDNDVDCYKFKATRTGKVTLKLSALKDNTITATVKQKGSSKKLAKVSSKSQSNLVYFNVKKGKRYTINVRGSVNTYSLRVS